MNVYLDRTYDITFFKQGSVWLGEYQDRLFEYLDNLVDNSLILNVTFTSPKTFKALKSQNLASYKNIFILDVVDPPEYGLKWDKLYEILKDHINKTYYISTAHKNPHFKTLYFDSFLHFGPEKLCDANVDVDLSFRKYKKKFVSLNANPHYHRVYLVNYLFENNLLDDGYVSAHINTFMDGIDWQPANLNLSNEFLDILPISLPSDMDVSFWRSKFKDYTRENGYYEIIPAYLNAPVNLVTETSIYNDSIFFSEKILKPVIAKQLVMLLGSPLSYKFLTSTYKLHNYGFDFEPKISDKPFEDKVKYYCDFLKETSLQDLESIHREKEDILEHNKNVVLTQFKDISFNLFLTSLKKYNIIPS